MQKLKKGCVCEFFSCRWQQIFSIEPAKAGFTLLAHGTNKMTTLALQSLPGLGTL
jgi:hypothetical protein